MMYEFLGTNIFKENDKKSHSYLIYTIDNYGFAVALKAGIIFKLSERIHSIL